MSQLAGTPLTKERARDQPARVPRRQGGSALAAASVLGIAGCGSGSQSQQLEQQLEHPATHPEP